MHIVIMTGEEVFLGRLKIIERADAEGKVNTQKELPNFLSNALLLNTQRASRDCKIWI